MNTLLEILKYILPSLVVFAACWFPLKALLSHNEISKSLQIRLEMQKTTLPVRMQAYERLVLLLERLQPAGLILRTNTAGMSAVSLHTALLQAIREEFDHNLSQQLYVSVQAWELVKNSREETIKMVNTAGSKMEAEATSADLAGQIFVLDMETNPAMTLQAIDFLKKEAREYFF